MKDSALFLVFGSMTLDTLRAAAMLQWSRLAVRENLLRIPEDSDLSIHITSGQVLSAWRVLLVEHDVEILLQCGCILFLKQYRSPSTENSTHASDTCRHTIASKYSN